jgi:hypothetical protein
MAVASGAIEIHQWERIVQEPGLHRTRDDLADPQFCLSRELTSLPTGRETLQAEKYKGYLNFKKKQNQCAR